VPDLPPLDRLTVLLARLDRRRAALARRSAAFSRARLALVLVGGTLALVAGGTLGAGWGWTVALVVTLVFAVAVRLHDRVEAARTRLGRWRAVQARHVAALTLDWAALGEPPAPAPPDHPFAADLDLAGPRSVLHLLDGTRATGGSERLRGWLLAAAPDEAAARTRQARVRALVPRRRLRDRLALLGLEAAGKAPRWDAGPIRAWLTAPPPDASLTRWAVVLSGLALTNVALVVLAVAGGPSLWGYSFLLYLALYLWRYSTFATVFDRAYNLQDAVAGVAPALLWLERDRAGTHPDLAPVWAPLRGEDRPSQHLRRLRRLTTAASITRNDVGRVVLNALLPYDLLLSLALHRLRGALAGVAPAWLDAYHEIDALASLAAYADLRPDHTVFPDLHDGATPGPLVEAHGLRHPLLPATAAVGNSVTLGAGEVVIVTGSNMSGKSTFLRAVGVASVLGWAGGAVEADRLRLRPVRPFTSMRVGDVLQEGLSTFYAEVRRLRALLDCVEAPGAPALVLIDEMLRGTNNRERLAGAQAIVRALAGTRATSLVATHDLALAELEGTEAGVSNAHFQEEAQGDRLAFDYRLRPGPCPTTNALVIMQRAGLPVEPLP